MQGRNYTMNKLNIAKVIESYHDQLNLFTRAKLAFAFEQGLRIYVGRNFCDHVDVRLSIGDDRVGAYGETMANASFNSKYEFKHVYLDPDDWWERSDSDDDSPASDSEIDSVLDYLKDQGETKLYGLLELYVEDLENS
jgi:hypothetical protein